MIRFYNGRVLKFAGDYSVSPDEVWTDGGVIAYVGPKRQDAPKFEREIDLRGDILLPGIKNAHTHSAMTALRSFADDLPLKNWLFDKVFPIEAKLTPDHVYAFSKLAILEYLSSGSTAIFDMYMHVDAFAAAVSDCGFKAVICGASDDLNLQKDLYTKYNNKSANLSYRFGFHAEYTAEKSYLEELSALAKSYNAPVSTHCSETKNEVDGCIEKYGMTPPALFENLGLLDNGGTLFHCVHVNENDIEILKRRGAYAVTCPASNAKLASGIAPISDILKSGVNLAIGTDGPASNNALSMFREMYLCAVLAKIKENDAAAIPAETLLKAAVQGGRAMGLNNCESIKENSRADLCVISIEKPNMRPLHDVYKNIVYSADCTNVRLTMVEGKILYENGNYYIGEDPEDIYKRAEQLFPDLVQ
ncbi:MAG: amidohydrolase [Ruminococcaceae bacterium]|nr:amidohydrolase [Oscillospiraceae bacterium]